jgi:phenylacetate-coenzyme A ligase PaaK-like adenylate-forming protein
MPAEKHDGPSLEAARSAYEEKCRLALETALWQTPVYERWRTVDPRSPASLDEQYKALPVLTKDDIRAAFPYGLVPRGLDLDGALTRGEVSFVRTSGTSDESLQNIWNQGWWDASERSSWKLNSVASRVATGAHPEAILASALSVGPHSKAGPLGRGTRMLGRFLFLNEYGRTEEWPEGHERRMLVELTDFKPAVLEANPSLLARLARYAARTGAFVWQPPLIVFTYEFISALHLRDIRQVFSSPVASSYGSTEAGYVFMECERGCLHQNTDSCRVDLIPIDGSDGVPEPGGLGKILASTFGNKWFPLLRFEMGDIGRVAAESCPCGRSFGITLSAIEGRMMSLLVAEGRLMTHREADLALSNVEGLEQYRLDQEAPRDVRLSVVARPGMEAQTAKEAEDRLQSIFGTGVRITVNVVKELFPEKSGKFLLAHRSFMLEAPHG